jgi:GNAT superfamily N-acetyltransferase
MTKAGRVHRLLYRLLDANRTLGLRRLLWVAPQWLVRQEYLVLVKDLRLPLPEVPSHESLRWTDFTEAQIDRVLAINPALSETEIRRRLKEGQECLLGWMGESLVHYRWDALASPYLPYLEKRLCFLQGDIFATDIFTHPAFRGRGIQTVSSIMALHRARDSGLSRFITMPAWWNAPSLRVNLQKTGRIVAGTVGFWNAGLWRYYFTSGDVCLDESGDIHIRFQKRLDSSHSLGRIK